MLKQIIKTLCLLGPSRAIRMKKRHDAGLTHIRGYAACNCWWTLLNNGFLDKLSAECSIELNEYIKKTPCNPEVLEAIIEYLDGIGLLQQRQDIVSLTKDGSDLLAEPRGMFELLWAYEPCFSNLSDLLKGTKKYNTDLTRRITYVGLGSGRLCEQLPYPVMRRMVLDHGCKMVLDLGCGDMALLAGLCKMDKQIKGHGIDISIDMIEYNNKHLQQENYNGRLTTQVADMFELSQMPADLPKVDCITACDTFHEYLGGQEDKLIEMLKKIKTQFPGTMFVIGEFCLQDQKWLAKYKTASLEHHLFHQLSNQQIGTAKQWRELFAQSDLEIIEEQIYDLIGHGYFALR